MDLIPQTEADVKEMITFFDGKEKKNMEMAIKKLIENARNNILLREHILG